MPTTEPPDITTMSNNELAQNLYRHSRSPQVAYAPWSTISEFEKDGWDNLTDYVRTLFAPPATPTTRRPIAISSDYSGDTVVCDDGTIWRRVPPLHFDWRQLPPIPQPDAPHQPDRDGVARHHGSSGQIAAAGPLTPLGEWSQRYRAKMAAQDRIRDAAPELLAVVKECVLHFDYCHAREISDGDSRYSATKPDEYKRLMDLCDTAIARAEGRR